MRELRRQSALFADTNRLGHAVQHLGCFLAHVRGVDAAHRSGYLGQLDHFFGRSEVARQVEQARGETEGAVEHGLSGETSHGIDLGWGGLAVFEADHFLPDASLPY